MSPTEAQLAADLQAAEDELLTRDDEAPADTATSPAAEPIGRSWQFDFATGRFTRSRAGALTHTRGLDTLRSWILKALHTPRGASPALPVDFGVPYGGINSLLGGPASELDTATVAEAITEALVAHPRIAAVRDITIDIGEADEAAFVKFTVQLDSDEELLIEEALHA